MKARKVTFEHWPILLKSLGRRIRQKPRGFFLPPKTDNIEQNLPKSN
jgi:hypothetical protein